MKSCIFIAVLLLGALGACSSSPKKPEPPATCSDLVAPCEAPIVEMSAKNKGISAEKTVQLMIQSPTLIGGKPADPANWPASVYARSGGSACSATLVGERVVFMAAHCMSNGGQISFTAGANQYTGVCSHHPEYRGNSTADWALCLVSRPVTGVPFEELGIDLKLAIGQSVELTGYGCINPGGGGGNDGIFRTGKATVRGLPSGKSYDVVTVGGAALCFGDSGGAAYVVPENGKRKVFATNSRGDIRTTSYLSNVFNSSFVTWMKSWAQASNNVRVCGVHSDAAGCRNAEEPPPPPPIDPKDALFEIATKAGCVKGRVSPAYQGKKMEMVDAVKSALEKF